MDQTGKYLKIAGLLAANKHGKLSRSEKEQLDDWLNENKNNRKLMERLYNDNLLTDALKENEIFSAEKAWRRIAREIDTKHTGHITRMKIMKYAAAVILLAGITVALQQLLVKNPKETDTANLIRPGEKKAILITPDNRQIKLGKTASKKIIHLKNARLTDTNAVLTYETDLRKAGTTEYNELIVPRGGEYSLILSDGSKIMVNSDSKLRFPVFFNNTIREVYLEGEAYFEVSKSDVPFVVTTNDMNVQVYGTAFNISAYPGDEVTHTTLVEGSVGVTFNADEPGKKFTLTPGYQAAFNTKHKKPELKHVDVHLYTAWTQGKFTFENAPLEEILTKLARWYDCDVEFIHAELKNERFTGDLKKYDDITKILHMISSASNIEFSITDRKITVYANQKKRKMLSHLPPDNQ